MMVSISKKSISPEEYLQAERRRTEKCEYINGQVIPMGGASTNHNQITGNLYFLLRTLLDESAYNIYSTDHRVHNPISQSYTYPDIVVVKGELEYLDDAFDTLLNPLLIAEVSSDSTFERDLHEKFVAYRKSLSFQEYILIAQDKVLIQKFFRIKEEQWEIEDFDQLEQKIKLKSVPAEISVYDIYKKVQFGK